MKELRKRLEQIEEKGKCYIGNLLSGGYGTCWVDEENETAYEYDVSHIVDAGSTEMNDLTVNDLSDEELQKIQKIVS